MKIKMSKASVQAAIATTVVAVSVTWAILLNGTNHSLKDLLDTTRLQKEQLLSEKIAVEKELKKTSAALEKMIGQNADMDKSIVALQSDIAQKESALKNMSFNNKKALEQERKKLEEIKQEMDKNLEAFNLKTKMFEQNIQELNESNTLKDKTIAALEKENSELRNNLSVVQSMAADNYLVETTKGKKDKQTIVARKTDNIQIQFAVPEYLNSALRCAITTPDGRVLNSDTDMGFSFIDMPDDELYASLYYTGNNLNAAQNIKMIYTADHKMKPGIYNIDVYSNKVHLGNCKIRLK